MAGADGQGSPDHRGRALVVIAISLALGVLGHLLFDEALWRLNFAIWTMALVGGAAYLWRRTPLQMCRECAWLSLPILLFASMLAWRDSESLRALNVVMTALLGALVVARIRTPGLTKMSLSEMFGGIFSHWACLTADFWVLVFGDVGWKRFGDPTSRRRGAAVARGLVFATPVLIIFGSLLSSADAVFSGYVQGLFEWDVASLVRHLTETILLAWLAGSIYRRMFVAERSVLQEVKKAFEVPAYAKSATPPPLPPQFELTAAPTQKKESFGVTEASIILGSLNALFLAFVLVQVKFLFGGHDLVQTTPNFTYAEYAHSGFIELVWVVLLSLPLLIVIPNAVRNGSGPSRIITILCAMTIGLLFVVMASAFKRMGLYVEAYGLSVLRFNVAAFMAWMGMCLVVLAATTLAGRPQRFAFGSVVCTCIAVLGMNAINPDALIANVNLDRFERTGKLDLGYLTGLSADAAPAIVNRLSASSRADAKEVLEKVLSAQAPASGDWREWNWGKARAASVLQRREE